MYAIPYTYLLISDLSLISIILYIRLCLQVDPYPFFFGSPASTMFRSASRSVPRLTAVALTAGKDLPREPTFGHSVHHRSLRVLIELLHLRNRSIRKSPLPPRV